MSDNPLTAVEHGLLTECAAGGYVTARVVGGWLVVRADGTRRPVGELTIRRALLRGWLGLDAATARYTLTDAGRTALATDRARGVGAGT